MESVNLIKGYGKLNHVEEQSPLRKQPTGKPIIKAIIAVFLLTVVITLTITTLAHNSKTKSSSSLSSIRAICNVTRYPTTCISTLSSTNLTAKADPITIFKQSLQLTILELQKLKSSIKPLIPDVDSPEAAALHDCMEQFDDAVSRLRDSVDIIQVDEKTLNDRRIRDIQTWVSAALTDEQTCLDGLKEVDSTAIEDVKAKMVRSQQLTSNSLAIIAHMHSFIDRVDVKKLH